MKSFHRGFEANPPVFFGRVWFFFHSDLPEFHRFFPAVFAFGKGGKTCAGGSGIAQLRRKCGARENVGDCRRFIVRN